MRRIILPIVIAFALVGCSGTSSIAQEMGGVHPDGPPSDTAGVHYKIFRPDGTMLSLDELVQAIDGSDAVLVGEEHDDPIAHYLQFELFKGLHQHRSSGGDGRGLQLSLEMFTTDVQYIVDEYLSGFISEKSFLDSANPWKNYKSDYRPAVEYAKENKLKVSAANAPRRYASRVTSMGPEALAELPGSARQWLPPLPYTQASSAYIAEWNQTMRENSHGAPVDSTKEIDDSVAMYPNMLAAQSLWDASMAYSIANGLMRVPGSSVMHFVGAFHVENGTGIPEHLLRYRPDTEISIISIRSKDELGSLDMADAGLGDYIIVTDGALPRTHERF